MRLGTARCSVALAGCSLFALATITAAHSWAAATEPPTEPAASALVATQITAANAAQHVQQGLDAVGGIGDWALSNGTLCAIISDVAHESDLSTTGGALTDLGYCDRADDQFVTKQDLLDGSIKRPLDRHLISAVTGPEAASILVTSHAGGLLQEVRFTLDQSQPNRLAIHKRFYRRSDDAVDFSLLVPMLFNYHSMETFLLSTADPALSTGFEHADFSSGGVRGFAAAARRADTIVALGNRDVTPAIAYGWQLLEATRQQPDGATEPLPRFAASDRSASVFVVLSEPFTFGGQSGLGMTELLQLALMDLPVGTAIELREQIIVGRDRTVASITDQLYAQAPKYAGRVRSGSTPAAAVVLVDRVLGDGELAPFTQTEADRTGRYALRLPAGQYQLTARASGDRSATADLTISDSKTTTTLPALTLPAPARLTLPRGEPMRLVFEGLKGTADPELQPKLTGYRVLVDGQPDRDHRVPMVFLAGIESDRESVELPAGLYRVHATRGIEYELTQAEVELIAGQTTALVIDAPRRAVETPGFIAADLHVHSGPSMDNGFAPQERVRTFVAEHGEVMVASEHETLFDFQPLLEAMAVTDRMATITGTEMTGQVSTVRMPYSSGHANFFPLTPQPLAFRRGVPANEGRRLREVLFDVRQQNPKVYAQLNHARESDQFLDQLPEDLDAQISNGAYLEHMGPAGYPYDPRKPLDSTPNQVLIEPDPVTGLRDIDFDAMEILNGTHDYSPTRRRALLADWFSLLLQGERLAGTANSDSHGKQQQVALPRNMVAVQDDRIGQFDSDHFIEQLRGGHFYGTTGPLLRVSLRAKDGGQRATLGDQFTGAEATLEVQVQRANWVPAQEVRVRINGEVVQQQPLSDSELLSWPLRFAADSFVVVEVEGEPGEAYRRIYPGQRPYAFSNPIYVDADADGRWSPPGL